MQQQGTSDEQVVQLLRDKGTSYRDIADALAQTKIKAAVEQPNTNLDTYTSDEAAQQFSSSSPQGMQPSMMTQAQAPQAQESIPQPMEYYPPAPGQQAYPQQQQEYPPQYQDYNQQPQSQSISADLISEIAEQIVAEKLSELRKHLEKVIDLKSTFESRTEYLDERLKRIEKTIDVLQSSVLRKVGDYVTNVQDLKSELVETQKTFAKLADRKHPDKTQEKK